MIQDDYRHYIGKNSIYFGNVINEITVGDVASPGFYSGKDGMPFFWAEIQKGKEWNWYNNIQGSMTKKPQGKTCYNMLVDTVDKNTGYTNSAGEKNAVIENMCIQNFIPSEKNFYRDINDIKTLTGLRKVGKGRIKKY